MVRREKANYLIQSVSHALDVIEALCQACREVGVTELSKQLKLHKNNVFRLLATLELRGYVEQNKETEDYRLGVRCLQLGQSFAAQNGLVARSYPILKTLSENLGETVSLAVLQNGQIHYPVTIDSKRSVKVAPRVGVSFPAKNIPAGRLLTAQLSDAILNELLASNTPQDAAIRSQLNELRSTGAIIDKGVIEADVVTVARAVRGPNGDIVAAIEVLAPQYRAKTEQIVPAVEEAAATVSQALGGVTKAGLTASIEREVGGAQQQAVQALISPSTASQAARIANKV